MTMFCDVDDGGGGGGDSGVGTSCHAVPIYESTNSPFEIVVRASIHIFVISK